MASTRQLRITFLFALVMLIAQFLLGMAVNLFVKIPTDHPGSNPPEYFSGVVQSVTWAILHGNVLLAIHAGYGLALVIAAIATLVQAMGIGGVESSCQRCSGSSGCSAPASTAAAS